MPMIPTRKAEFFKALAHPVRIRILEVLGDGELSVSDLQARLELEQSHVSQQLGVLRRAGFVESRREGSSVRYSLGDARISEILALARSFLLDTAAATQRDLAAT